MGIFNRAILVIKRNIGKSSLLFGITFILGTFFLSAFVVSTAIQNTEEEMMRSVPTIATVYFDETLAIAGGNFDSLEGVLSLSVAELLTIGTLPYVQVYDFFFQPQIASRELVFSDIYFNESWMPSSDANMAHWILQGAHSRGAEMELFVGRGVINPEITEIQAGLLELIDGRTFTQTEIETDAHVILISYPFALANNLAVGSIIELENIAYDYDLLSSIGTGVFEMYRHLDEVMAAQRILSFEVIGIFDVTDEFNYNDYGTRDVLPALSARLSLYNRIYMPIGVAEDMELFVIDARNEHQIEAGMILDEPFLDTLFLLYDPRNLSIFIETATELLPDFWGIRYVTGEFSLIISSLNNFQMLATNIRLVATIMLIVVLTLLIMLFLRDRRHEIGIYMVLGDKKKRIVSQILLEIGITSLTAIILATFASSLVANQISSYMLEQQLIQQIEVNEQVPDNELSPWETILFNPRDISLDELMKMYNVSLSTELLVTSLGVVVIVIAVATIIPIGYLIKLEPKKVLILKD